MMGFGSFSHGSSSSSSNLSPLAQPFAVDRSLPKPNQIPLVPFTEDFYSYSFQPSFDNWLHLHPPSVPDPFSKSSSFSELDSTHDANLSCESNYGNCGNSFGTHLKPKIATSSIGSFPYDLQQSEGIRTTLVEAKPYYPQYPLLACQDGSNPLFLNDSGCDMLSASSFAPFGGTYQTSYTRDFSVGYTGRWSGFCDGLPDDEQMRKKGLDGNLLDNGNHDTDSMTDKNFPKQGIPAPEGLTAKHSELSARNCASLLDDTARVSPFNSSRPGALAPASILQEAHYPQAPSPASFMKTWSSLFPDSASYEGCLTHLDSCTADPAVSYASVTSSSPTPVFGAMASGASSLALETSPSRNVNFSQQPRDAFGSNECAGCITSNIKDEPLIWMSSKGLLKSESELQANYFKLSDPCTVVSGGAGIADSAEGSSEIFDQFNPVVDSPCWKGASYSRHSAFGAAEVVSPYLTVKGFGGSISSNLEGSHILAGNVDDAAVSSQKEGGNLVPDGNEYGADGSSFLSEGLSSVVNFPSVQEDELKDSVKVASYHSKVNIDNEIPCSEVIQELTQPRKDNVPSINTKSSELKPSQMKQISYCNNIRSAELFSFEAAVVNSAKDCKDLTQESSSCVQFNPVEHASSFPFCLDSVPVGLAKKISGASDTGPNIDIQLLVNAMHNLSELLRSSCSNDVEALNEQDHDVIRRIINNLDACLLMKVGLMRSMRQLQSPESSTCFLRKTTDPQKVSQACRSQFNSIEAVDGLSKHDLKGKMHITDPGNQGNKLQDFLPMDGETEIEIDNDMTQAMKILTKEKFDNEEKDLQIKLFKNLWLEAEAALCSAKYRAYYDRMKTEMENCEREQEKDVDGKPIDNGGYLSPKVSCDLGVDYMLTQEMEKSTVPDNTNQVKTSTGIAVQAKDVEASLASQADDVEASLASQADDVEASVMSRFRILKCRVDNCSSLNHSSRNEGHPAGSTGIGAYAGREETISSLFSSGTQNIRTKTHPINVVDWSSSDGKNPLTFSRDRSEDGHLEMTITPDMQHPVTNFIGEKIELDSDVPGRQDPLKVFGVCISGEPVNTLIPNRDGNQCIAGGFDSPSSDWEHVLKEELKWQN